MTTFQLDEDLEFCRKEFKQLADQKIAHKAAYWDEKEIFPQENLTLLAELGYLGMLLPEAYGGSGASMIQGVILLEELARVCFNTALIAHGFMNGPPKAINILGTEEQKRRLLPDTVKGKNIIVIAISEPDAGSAVTDLKTNVRKDGERYVLNGSKCFVTLGALCTHALVFARFGKSQGAKGIGAVIVDRSMEGFSTGRPDQKMGGRGCPEAELFFDDVILSKENILVEGDPEDASAFKKLIASFGPERIGNAAMCLGLAQGAYELALEYSKTRCQFGINFFLH